MIKIYFRLWSHLSRERKSNFFLLVILMIISSIAELLSLAMLLPFMSIILEPNSFKQNNAVIFVLELLGLSTDGDFLLYITLFFIAITTIAGISRYSLLVYNSKFTFGLSSELSVNIYRKVLSQSFENHIGLNSSVIINGITQKVNSTIYAGVNPLLTLITSTIIVINIVILLTFLNTNVVLQSVIVFAIVYLIIVLVLKNRIATISKIFPEKSTLAVKLVQEGLGNIRDVIIDSVQNVYVTKFARTDKEFKNAQRDNMIYAGLPKIFIESILMISIAYLLYYLSRNDIDLVELLPVFSVFIVSAQRILPLVQTIYSSYTSVMSSKYSIMDVLKLLDIDTPCSGTKQGDISLNDQIELKNITFTYKGAQDSTIKNLSLVIKKGERLGIVGETGSGKSTLVDILMGLLTPQLGVFLVDGKDISTRSLSSWQKNVAHVPQSIYLSDSSLYENIAFGIDYPKINKSKVASIVKKVGLDSLVKELPKGLDTIVGERGSKLSGGQRQRIGIARALYKEADVLFLDEATSALDNRVERSIMEVIDSLQGITVIMIAHRLSTLQSCERIIEIHNGTISRECTYNEL